jgi:molecular chaperone GrpE
MSICEMSGVFKQNAFIFYSDVEVECDLSRDELVKLATEKEALLKLKQKEIEKMQDKVLRTYAEMENVMDRTKRNAENSKKFAIQVYVLTFFCFVLCCIHLAL